MSKEQETGGKKPEEQKQETSVSADYRSLYQKKSQKKEEAPQPKKSGASGTKKKNQRKAIGSAIEATVNTMKEKVPTLLEDAEGVGEPDSELDDFLQEGEEDSSEELLTKQPMAGLDADEIATAAKRKRRRKRRYGIFAGAVVMVLALVGVGFIVTTVGKQIYNVVTDDSKLREYDTFLSAVVMQDPEPFEDPADADGQMILTASIWRAIMNHGTEYNEYDELGRTIVPLVDVSDACHELFGPDCGIRPEDAPEDSFYEYDSEKNNFHVAPFSSQSSFAPYTVSSKKSGAATVLKVGYVAASDEWRNDAASEVTSPTPVKYMEYVLQPNSETGKEYIAAVRISADEE